MEAAEAKDALGGYREGLTIKELDETWPNEAVRDARVRDCPGAKDRRVKG